MTEYEFGQHIAALAAKTNSTPLTSAYGVVQHRDACRNPAQRVREPVWYTSYTPYQDRSVARTPGSPAELPDRRMRPHRHAPCQLPLLDEATAAAEAVTMMYALRPRDMQKSGANVVFVDESVFPQTLAVVTTRAIPQGIQIRTGKLRRNGTHARHLCLQECGIRMPAET